MTRVRSDGRSGHAVLRDDRWGDRRVGRAGAGHRDRPPPGHEVPGARRPQRSRFPHSVLAPPAATFGLSAGSLAPPRFHRGGGAFPVLRRLYIGAEHQRCSVPDPLRPRRVLADPGDPLFTGVYRLRRTGGDSHLSMSSMSCLTEIVRAFHVSARPPDTHRFGPLPVGSGLHRGHCAELGYRRGTRGLSSGSHSLVLASISS